MGDVERRLGTAREGRAHRLEHRALVYRSHVERIGRERAGHHLASFGDAARPTEQGRLEPECHRLRGVGRERPLDHGQGVGRAPVCGGDLGPCQVGGRAVGAIPEGLAEGLVGLLRTTGQAQRHAQQIAGFAIPRVRVVQPQALERGAQVSLCLDVFATTQVPLAHGRVAAAVPRVAAQGLAVVGLRPAGGVAVLLQVHAGQPQLLERLDPGRWRWLGRGRRRVTTAVRPRLVADAFGTAVLHSDAQVGHAGALGQLDGLRHERPLRRQVHDLLEDRP